MRQSFIDIYNRLWTCLKDHGFVPMQEFSAQDSLDHADEMLGVISFEGSTVLQEALKYVSIDFCMEVDHKFCLRLYGKSGNFADYEKHRDACYEVFYDLVSDPEFMICKMEISKAVQSMPLQRIERKIELTIRTIEKAEVE